MALKIKIEKATKLNNLIANLESYNEAINDVK